MAAPLTTTRTPQIVRLAAAQQSMYPSATPLGQGTKCPGGYGTCGETFEA